MCGETVGRKKGKPELGQIRSRALGDVSEFLVWGKGVSICSERRGQTQGKKKPKVGRYPRQREREIVLGRYLWILTALSIFCFFF